jgi:hypothetical protein
MKLTNEEFTVTLVLAILAVPLIVLPWMIEYVDAFQKVLVP